MSTLRLIRNTPAVILLLFMTAAVLAQTQTVVATTKIPEEMILFKPSGINCLVVRTQTGLVCGVPDSTIKITANSQGSTVTATGGGTIPVLPAWKMDRWRIGIGTGFVSPTQVFTASFDIVAGSECKMWRDGTLLFPGDDYTVSGKNFTLLALNPDSTVGHIITTGDKIQLECRYQ